ncbi:glucuronate isomerase [Aureliella helgolandensis]|uniref:Glucuronate isomerase n=1 Tax=Aureliella helgolandensis TaxID=2527968 RepID=A0A518GF81_9BACT|nr:glucuronate isomerase [Aureliella helgolandensis]QDV27256.1 glucuronate isomerase [Aureliella helgolandensis]
MSAALKTRLFDELNSHVLIDPHTHINPHSPASETLADILGYHYYTELAHSAGMPQSRIEDATLTPKEKVGRLVEGLGHLDNTVQLSWLLEAARELFGVELDRIDASNWESLYDAAQKKFDQPDWEEQVLRLSKLEAVFLTNDFDDALEGFDTGRYVPCLRTDDLVFHLAKPAVRQRLQACSATSIDSLANLQVALRQRFEHFTAHQVRACAISLPPHFTPQRVSDAAASSALDKVLAQNEEASEQERATVGYWIFWKLAEFCAEFRLPFDLMIGVNRAVYPAGVFQGQDLYDSRVSLIQYRELFNAFPSVTFPVSVLASVTNQELVSYAWIFPNVVCNGHWWYSNTPSFIRRDLQARLEAVPRNKIVGYYSDMYKLEFALPKFAMFKRCLASVLAEHFVESMGWSEQRAVELGLQTLRGNVESLFYAQSR